jgi:rare lipoprotein A (peptidoglycan hydrolase)
VSSSAAKILGFYEQGICQVKIEVVQDSITIK